MEQNPFSRLREWMSTAAGRWAAIALVLLAVGGAAAMFFSGSGGEADDIRSGGRRYLYYCRQCQATGEIRLAWDAKFPVNCPKCGKREAVIGFRCSKCGRIIEDRRDPVFECPHCHQVYDNRLNPWKAKK